MCAVLRCAVFAVAAAFRGTPLDDGADAAVAEDGSRTGKGRKRRTDGGGADDDDEEGPDEAPAAAAAGPASKKPRAAGKPAAAKAKPAPKPAKRGGRVNIQYEQEVEREMEQER